MRCSFYIGGNVNNFDPPFELHIYFTQADLDFASRDGKPISFAYWDVEDSTWVKFDNNHNLEIVEIDRKFWSEFDRTYQVSKEATYLFP